MDLRERRNRQQAQPGSGGASGGQNLGSLSADAERMLAAADRAIERSLSTDSGVFLRANRQQGGQ